MKLSPIIHAIRTDCPRFEQRVGGAAEYGAALEGGKLPLPAAYVIPGEDSTGDQRSQTDYWQPLTERFSVVVLLNNLDDRGQQAACDAVHDVSRELWSALLAWEPVQGEGKIDYVSSEFIDINRLNLVWQFHFQIQTDIHAQDTRQAVELAKLDTFERLSIECPSPASSTLLSLE